MQKQNPYIQDGDYIIVIEQYSENNIQVHVIDKEQKLICAAFSIAHYDVLSAVMMLKGPKPELTNAPVPAKAVAPNILLELTQSLVDDFGKLKPELFRPDYAAAIQSINKKLSDREVELRDYLIVDRQGHYRHDIAFIIGMAVLNTKLDAYEAVLRNIRKILESIGPVSILMTSNVSLKRDKMQNPKMTVFNPLVSMKMFRQKAGFRQYADSLGGLGGSYWCYKWNGEATECQ